MTEKHETQNPKHETKTEPKSVLAVIMARGGSVGLPGKSLRALLGRRVIDYTFDQVKESRLITRTVLSSDDPAILQAAKDANIEPLPRPPELATATSATDPVLRHAVRTLYPDPASRPAAVVMLYGNVPIRANHMIDRCIDLLFSANCDSVQTIAPVGKMHPYWMFDLSHDGKIQKHIPNHIFRRQDLPPLYSPTGAVYVIRTDILMSTENNPDPHAFLGPDRRALLVSPEDSVDIDTPKDLYLAEAVLREKNKVAPTPNGVSPSLQRHGGLSYLEIPATNPRASVAFYHAVLGWNIMNPDSDHPNFMDQSGHLLGRFTPTKTTPTPGSFLPYIYTTDVAAAAQKAPAAGGTLVKSPHREGNLLIATLRDPAGNTLGLWQEFTE